MTEFDVVLVGVDGSDVARAALVFAAHEADRRGARLTVAHACRASEHVQTDTQVHPFAQIVRAEAAATLAAIHPRLAYQIIQRDTGASELLVELSATADVLVVGTHRSGQLRGFVLGSVSQRVAAHAACPVVTISGPPEHDDGPIVLGASASAGGVAALRFACREAELRHVPVRAIRSLTTEDWALSGPANALLLIGRALRDAARTELDTVLRAARERYPNVTVTGEVSDRDPFTALLAATGGASLLVIGSRRSHRSTLPHLGPVAAWLLHQATCPLAVVGHAVEDVPLDVSAAALSTSSRT